MTQHRTSPSTDVGIASIAVQLPQLAMDVRELAELRGIDPDKFTKGLGCNEMALCGAGEGVVQLASGAARRALERWGGDPSRIGMLAVGTETAQDMSRPLSAFVAEELGLQGAVRSYEAKHACYGGTLALRQALEWRLSGAARGKAALVIAADEALYTPESAGEPTQGAGAVAFVVDDARVARVDLDTYPYSEPAYDFWRPVGEACPRVDGPLSLECYMRATEACFRDWIGDGDSAAAFDGVDAVCFHVPFPKMVKKAVMRLGESFGWSEERTPEFFEQKVAPTLRWNKRVGNAYTASLWMSVADALGRVNDGDRIAALSYGSGCGAELLLIDAGPDAARSGADKDVEADFAARRFVDGNEYVRMRS